MGAPLATSVPTMVGLLIAALVLWLIGTVGLRLAVRQPATWGGR